MFEKSNLRKFFTALTVITVISSIFTFSSISAASQDGQPNTVYELTVTYQDGETDSDTRNLKGNPKANQNFTTSHPTGSEVVEAKLKINGDVIENEWGNEGGGNADMSHCENGATWNWNYTHGTGLVLADTHCEDNGDENENGNGDNDDNGDENGDLYDPVVYKGGSYCPEGTEKSKIDSYEIDSTDEDGKTFSLEEGSYLFKASGQYTFNKNEDGHYADAGHSTRDGWDSVLDDYGIYGEAPDLGAHSLLGDLGEGVGIVDWGEFNENNEYKFHYTFGSNQEVQFVISDRYEDWFGTNWDDQEGMDDNEGYLTLDIYECEDQSENGGNGNGEYERPERNILSEVGEVDDVEVDYGTSEEDARNELDEEVTVTSQNNEEEQAEIENWEIDDYDGESPGDYDATGSVILPDGWILPEGGSPSVTATVTVGEAPQTSSSSAGQRVMFLPSSTESEPEGEVLGETDEQEPEGEVLGEMDQRCDPYLTQFIRPGRYNDPGQVRKLQRFLNDYNDENLEVTGAYGMSTIEAVERLQSRYADEILTPWGINQPTGFVYMTTLRFVNKSTCPDKEFGMPDLVPASGHSQPTPEILGMDN